jgi:protein arginine kinase
MNDVVISSRVRLARNLSGFPFLSTAADTDRSEIYRLIADEVSSVVNGGGALLIDIDRSDDLDKQWLVERHLISRQHAEGEGSRFFFTLPKQGASEGVRLQGSAV